jgi:hypothetical protein
VCKYYTSVREAGAYPVHKRLAVQDGQLLWIVRAHGLEQHTLGPLEHPVYLLLCLLIEEDASE